MKLAIVHDFLTQYGGTERCLDALKEIFPDAPIYTLLYDREKLPQYKNWDIRTSFLQKCPLWKKNHYIYFPFYQNIIERFDLSDYDIVLTISVNYAKGVILNENTMHICYCITPSRFAYSMEERYINNFNSFYKKPIKFLVKRFKNWDMKTKERPHYYITISNCVKERIKKYYNKDSEVIYPPINTDFFKSFEDKTRDDFYLLIARFKEFKNIPLAIKAFNKLEKPLFIVGSGDNEEYFRKISNKNIRFLGELDSRKQKDMHYYYSNCKALILPSEEDFGIVSVETQACGRPVIAFAKGGALETVIAGRTGVFFDEETPESLHSAVKRFEKIKFDRESIRQNALKFDKKIFKEKIKEFIYLRHEEFKDRIR